MNCKIYRWSSSSSGSLVDQPFAKVSSSHDSSFCLRLYRSHSIGSIFLSCSLRSSTSRFHLEARRTQILNY
ncbi:hypothetical protein NL676_029693 [Syzygium grande]|nr:hypothetical protein NL676_029693 [Syzygium grande]